MLNESGTICSQEFSDWASERIEWLSQRIVQTSQRTDASTNYSVWRGNYCEKAKIFTKRYFEQRLPCYYDVQLGSVRFLAQSQYTNILRWTSIHIDKATHLFTKQRLLVLLVSPKLLFIYMWISIDPFWLRVLYHRKLLYCSVLDWNLLKIINMHKNRIR